MPPALSEIAERILEDYYLTPTSPAYTEHWIAGEGPSYRRAKQELVEAGYIRETIPGVGKYRLTPAGYREASKRYGPAPTRTYPGHER